MRHVESLSGPGDPRSGEEPGFVVQALELFRGRTGWVSIVLAAVQTLAFLAGVWTAWNFFSADETLQAVRWGLPAAVLLATAISIKMALWRTIQINQLRAEIRRLELMMARADPALRG
jgi:hypothetical protein